MSRQYLYEGGIQMPLIVSGPELTRFDQTLSVELIFQQLPPQQVLQFPRNGRFELFKQGLQTTRIYHLC